MVVVVFGNGFDSWVWKARPFSGGRRECRRLRTPSQSCRRPDDGLHGHQIDDSVKLIFLSDGNLNGDGLGIEALAESIDGVLEIGAHLVDLVDEANARNAIFIGLTPNFFGLRCTPWTASNTATAPSSTRRDRSTSAVKSTCRGIDDVDADVAPGAGRRAEVMVMPRSCSCSIQSMMRCFVDLADAVRLSRIKQDALRRRGLPGVDVGHDADVPARSNGTVLGTAFILFLGSENSASSCLAPASS